MRRALAILASLVLYISVAFAQVPMTGAGLGAPVSGGGFPTCGALTTFLARTSGTSANEQGAYGYIICNGTTHGWYSKCDAVYWFATNTTTSANLNLVSSSFGLTSHGTLTFTADQGYTGDGSTGYLDTGITPSAGGLNFVQNSNAFGGYLLNGRTTPNSSNIIGAVVLTGSNNGYTYMQPLITGPSLSSDATGGTFPSVANGNTKGDWLTTRTGSTGPVTTYKNGSSFLNTATDASTGLPDQSIVILAMHDKSGIDDFSTDQIAAALVCAGFTSTDAGNADTDLNAAATVLGINVH